MKILCKYKACILKFAKCIHSTYNHLVVNIKYQLMLYEKVWKLFWGEFRTGYTIFIWGHGIRLFRGEIFF